tara:strand:+ start:1136 stop:1414 length:279 start_codon:yes stop_codon:yes gene_type:complete
MEYIKEEHYDIFGYIGAGFLTLLTYPQVFESFKKKSTEGISSLFIFFQIMASFFFLVYGVLINSLPMMIANTSALFGSLILAFFKCFFKDSN